MNPRHDEQIEEIRANEATYSAQLAELKSLTAALEDDIVESSAAYESTLAALQEQLAAEAAASSSSSSPSGGHVGIYIGNAYMVNAASTKSGICISKVDSSRSGFTVRRII